MRETKPTGAFASAIRVLCTCTIMGALTTAALEAQDYRVLLDASGEVRDDAYDHLRRAVFGSDRVYEGIDGRHLKTLMTRSSPSHAAAETMATASGDASPARSTRP